MKRDYEFWAPQAATREIVAMADAILTQRRAEGLSVTLRELYYQFVAANLLPNTQKSYDRLGEIINRARLAGLLDWSAMIDRTRNLRTIPSWDDPPDAISALHRQYAIDLWADQPTRVEVWVEKDALAGIIARASDQFQVPWFSCRGYVSQSEMQSAARRFQRYIRDEGQRVLILHLGDHDPSGLDMTRDIRDRLTQFIAVDLGRELSEVPGWFDRNDAPLDHDYLMERIGHEYLATADADPTPLEVRRIALNMSQIRQYNPPPNWAKVTDSRAVGYIAEHGRSSWELDSLSAIAPQVIIDLIQTEIVAEVDQVRYDARQELRDEQAEQLEAVHQRWGDVLDLINSPQSGAEG